MNTVQRKLKSKGKKYWESNESLESQTSFTTTGYKALLFCTGNDWLVQGVNL